MSFFYLSAVKGDMPIHLLEIIITRRLDYLKDVLKENTLVYNEYVVEGSLYDNVSHFMLCVIAILGENTGFSQFFLKAEVELFRKRIASLAAYDIRSFAKKLIRSIRKHEETPYFFDSLLILSRHLVIKDLAQHLCLVTHTASCKDHSIKINFRHCLELVGKREVELRNGMASLPCGKWKHYLAILFRNNLRLRIQKTDLAELKSDPRVMDLLVKVRNKYFPCADDKSLNMLSSREVDRVSEWFPPCMQNLHQNLRNKHRLTHTQRFHYSLFLKDIGLPIEEAIDFWRLEYRQSPNGSHSCCHNWEKDEKKYLYGIRHMYGLEGRKKIYASVSCQCIQSMSNCSEGGCPFKSFDDPKMLKLLKHPSEILLAQINELRRKNMYTQSCLLYLNSISELIGCDNFSFNFTPVKFYTIASKESKGDSS